MELTTEQLKSRIAELEQQVAQLSKDKARLDLLASIYSTDIKTCVRRRKDLETRICFDSDGESGDSTVWGKSLREAIDAMKQEQEHE